MQRALIIDQSPIIRRIVRAILSDFAYEIDEAAKGSDGLALLARVSPRVVLVDAGLTDVSALDVLRHIRDHLPKGTQALYCPVQFDILELQRAHAAGATDVLVKPFDRSMLATRLELRAGTEAEPGRSSFFSRLSRSELVRI